MRANFQPDGLSKFFTLRVSLRHSTAEAISPQARN
jgi:hypothetical protein